VNAYDFNDTVEIVGQIPHKKIAEYMKNADFIILPSWSEGLPTVLVEAMACGLPVIATNVGGIPEIINKDVGILVEPKNPEKLAKGIMYAISKKWDRRLISDYIKNYTWEKNAEKTIEVYEEVLGGR